MEEQEDTAIDTKYHRKLDYNAPLLSTRRPSGATSLLLSRTNSQGVWRDTSNRIPFSWEKTPGKPKDLESNEAHDLVVPPPKLPPCRWLPPKEAVRLDNTHQCRHEDDGCDGDIDDDNDDDDVFSDAIDIFSLCESIEKQEPSEKFNEFGSVNSEIEECGGSQSPSFIIQRFLIDANALALSNNLNKNDSEQSSQAVKIQSHPSPQGCGLENFFPWRMKHKPCGLKNPVRQANLNPRPKWSARTKKKS